MSQTGAGLRTRLRLNRVDLRAGCRTCPDRIYGRYPSSGAGVWVSAVIGLTHDHRHTNRPKRAPRKKRKQPAMASAIVTPSPMKKGPLRHVIRLHEQANDNGGAAAAEALGDRRAESGSGLRYSATRPIWRRRSFSGKAMRLMRCGASWCGGPN
jgi:hypothetical protein